MSTCTSRFPHPRCGRGRLSTCPPKSTHPCIEADVNFLKTRVEWRRFITLSTRYGNPCRPAAALLEKILLDPKKRGDWENQLRSNNFSPSRFFPPSLLVKVDGEPGARCEERAEAAPGGSCARLQLGEHHQAGEQCPFSPPFQVGMFWFSGLSEAQGMALANHHVYVMPSKNFTQRGSFFYFRQWPNESLWCEPFQH